MQLFNSHLTQRFTLIALLFLLGACNTIAGMGEDIRHGGQRIENTAEKNK